MSPIGNFCDLSGSQREFSYRGISGDALEDIGEPLFDHPVTPASLLFAGPLRIWPDAK